MPSCDSVTTSANEAGANLAAIGRWRKELDLALTGQYSEHAVWPAFHDSIRRYQIPHEYFYQIIEASFRSRA